MRRFVRTILARLPRRRRRFWGYVSPRRRSVGLVLLAVLTLLVYGYWYVTNDRHIRELAQDYLSQASGGQVRIRRAHFSFFGGAELTGVRMYGAGGGSPEPIFQADKVVLRHRPWSLFIHGRLEPSEIICVRPIVTFEQNVSSEGSGGDLLAIARTRTPDRSAAWMRALPPIRLRNGVLRVVDVEDGVRQQASEVPINISLLPQDGKYLVRFEEYRTGDQPLIQGQMVVDLASLKVESVVGVAPLNNLDRALPRRFREWRKRYGLSGGEARVRSSDTADGAESLEVELIGVAMRTPQDQGGLEMKNVRGTLVFDSKGIALREITGRVAQLGDATFTLNGTYAGFDETSPCRIELRIAGMGLPEPRAVSGPLDKAVEDLRGACRPGGKLNLRATIMREQSAGEVGFAGSAELLGMDLTLAGFPYPLTDVRGVIDFSSRQVEIKSVTARHDKTSVRVDGAWFGRGGQDGFDLTVAAVNVAFDESLRSALPKAYLDAWYGINPGGSADMTLRTWKKDAADTPHVEMDIRADGRASMRHGMFAYPLEKIAGRVLIRDNEVEVQSVEAWQGDMNCRLSGRLRGLHVPGRSEMALTVEGKRLPLDAMLAKALSPSSRAVYESLTPAGMVSRLTARFTQKPGEAFHTDITATVAEASFLPRFFPYALERAGGTVRIVDNQLTIESLEGRHGKAVLTCSGEVGLTGDAVAMDVKVSARGLTLDEELYRALRPEVRSVWDRFAPGGTADVALRLRQGRDKPLDYSLELRPTGMRARYRDFPYTFQNVTGLVLAQPGLVLFKDLSAGTASAKMAMSGRYEAGEGRDLLTMSVQAANVSIDEELLAAMPEEVRAITQALRPGGVCDVSMQEMSFAFPAERERAAATAPARAAPTSTPARPTYWSTRGEVTVHKAVAHLAGEKTFSGTVSGTASRQEDGLALDAEVRLTDLGDGQRRIAQLAGHVRKGLASAVVRLDDLIAKGHGGRLAGFAELRLDETRRFGVSLAIEGLRVEELFGNGDAKTPRPDVKGQLEGNLHLTGSLDHLDDIQAVGEIRLEKGKLYKLPVLLGMLNVVYLALPGDSAFSDGQMTYQMRGRKIQFQEIYLTGPAMSLVGTGTADLRTSALRMNFLTGPPGKAPRIRGLADEVFRGISRELMEVQVRGTLAAPRMRAVPLRSFDRAIRELTNPEVHGD